MLGEGESGGTDRQGGFMGGWGKAAHRGEMSAGKEGCLGWAGQYVFPKPKEKRKLWTEGMEEFHP